MTERNRLPAALEFKLTPNYVFRFQCSNNSSFKYSEFVFMSDSSNDYKWRLYPVVFVKSEQCPILWNLALIHFSKDAMSMLIVSQITIDIQQYSTVLYCTTCMSSTVHSTVTAANMERGVTDPLESRLDSAGKSLNLN